MKKIKLIVLPLLAIILIAATGINHVCEFEGGTDCSGALTDQIYEIANKSIMVTGITAGTSGKCSKCEAFDKEHTVTYSPSTIDLSKAMEYEVTATCDVCSLSESCKIIVKEPTVTDLSVDSEYIPCGGEASLTVSMSSSSSTASVTVSSSSGSITGSGLEYTLKAPNRPEDITVTASTGYESTEPSVTVKVVGVESITCDGDEIIPIGEYRSTVTLSATESTNSDEGKALIKWFKGEDEVGSGATYDAPVDTAGTFTYTAKCGSETAKSITIKVIATRSASISPQNAKAGDVVQLTAILEPELETIPFDLEWEMFILGFWVPTTHTQIINNITTHDGAAAVFKFRVRASKADTWKETESLMISHLKDITATDSQHSGRVAHAGETLYLVGHNDAKIDVVGGLLEDEPTWFNLDIPDGTKSYDCNSPFDKTYEVYHNSKSMSVNIVRKQATKASVTSPTWDIAGFNKKFKDKLTFGKDTIGSLKVILPQGDIAASKEIVEVRNSPNCGWEEKISANLVGFGIEGKICHPTYSGSLDTPDWIGVEAVWELYMKGGVSGSVTGGVVHPPEEDWQVATPALKGSITGSFEVGFDVVVESSWGLYGEGEAKLSTSITGASKLENGSFYVKGSWGGVAGTMKLLIQKKNKSEDENEHDTVTNIMTIGGELQLIDGADTDWYELAL